MLSPNFLKVRMMTFSFCELSVHFNKTIMILYTIKIYMLTSDQKGHFPCIVCLVTLKIGKKIPKKSTGCQIFFLIIFILRTYYYIL